MNYKEHESGLIEIYCLANAIPALMSLLKIRYSQLQDDKALKVPTDL